VDMLKLSPDGKLKNRGDFSTQSGTARLSCPHLVQAVDQFEYKARGIERVNAALNETADDQITEGADVVDDTKPYTHTGMKCSSEEALTSSAQAMRQHFRDIIQETKSFREAVVSDSDRVVLKHKLGEEGMTHFINSGPGGILPDAVGDIKCLHIHVADALMRGEEANKFGRWALRKLKEEYDIDKDGCSGAQLTAMVHVLYMRTMFDDSLHLHCLYSPCCVVFLRVVMFRLLAAVRQELHPHRRQLLVRAHEEP
jgi:hypothetical protein